MKVAQAQLRHAGASTTARYYLHVVSSEQRAAATPSYPDWLMAEHLGLLEDAVNSALGDCQPGNPDDDVAHLRVLRIFFGIAQFSG